MYEAEIKKIMEDVHKNKISVDEAVKKLKFMPFEDLGFAKIDYHRALRKGFPEVVFCQNKSIEQVVIIVKKLAGKNLDVLATRATEEMFNEVKKNVKNAQYNIHSKTIIIKNKKQRESKISVDLKTKFSNNKNKKNNGKILVVSAGTSYINVAEEAAVVAEAMNNNVERL